MHEDLRESIKWLVSRLQFPANNNALFAGDVVMSLMEAGHSLPDIETELRRQGSLLHLLGLPAANLKKGLSAKIPSTHTTSRLKAPFYLYCAMNGCEEAESVLEAHGITVAQNLENLASTGIIFTDTDTSEAGIETLETEVDFVRRLVFDALDWLSRRALLREAERRRWLGTLADQLDRLVQESEDRPEVSDCLHAVRDTTRAAAQYGSASAFRACKPMVLEALQQFLKAPTWNQAGLVYKELRDVLEGDLAIEILEAMATEPKYTPSAIDVIGAHIQFLEVAFDSGVEAAIAAGDAALPAKYGLSERADQLVAYLSLPDLESARDYLHAYPNLFDSAPEEIDDALGRIRADAPLTQLVGMLEESKSRGLDASYELWTRLEDTTRSEPNRRTIKWLEQLAHRDESCLRDRALEVLVAAYDRLGRERNLGRTIATLLTGRSARMRPRRYAYDLINAALHEGARGTSEAVAGHLADVEDAVDMLHDPAARADLWEKTAHCFADFLQDTTTALHYHRRAVEDHRASGELVAATQQLLRIAWRCWDVIRPRLMLTYADLAAEELQQIDDESTSQSDEWGKVLIEVIEAMAFAELANGYTTEAADRLLDLLSQDMLESDGDLQRRVRALSVVAALYDGRVDAAREIVSSWRHPDPATSTLSSALASMVSSGVRLLDLHSPSSDDAPVTCNLDVEALRSALAPLVASRSALDDMLSSGSARAIAGTVASALGAPIPDDPYRAYMAETLLGEHEAAVWKAARSRRGRLAVDRDRPAPRPLPRGSSWKAITARYGDLGVWETPHLALYGPIVDNWGLASRFGRQVAVARRPEPGWLTFLFFRRDPEGHLDEYRNGCHYIAENDMVLCSLPFLDEAFGAQNQDFWEGEARRLNDALARSGYGDEVPWVSFAIQASARALIEWILAHEIGHAQYAHRLAMNAIEARTQERQADDFFIDGITKRGEKYVGEYLQAFHMNLRSLYRYSSTLQARHHVSDDEIDARSVKIIDRFDASGHRPLVLRAIDLIRRMLARYPKLDTTGYIEDFAGQVTGGTDKGEKP